MRVVRNILALAAAAGIFMSAPASAQFFLKPADLKGEPVTGAEPGMTGPELPNASEAELHAALVWNLRAALNVAALQCDFEPTLLTVGNYNALIVDHASELKSSYDTLEKYFTRVNSNNKKAGQTALDRFGTRVYSGFSTITGQYSFCQTAADIGREAMFRPRGQLVDLAVSRMRELRESLRPWGEQQFPRSFNRAQPQLMMLPPFGDDKCWDQGAYDRDACGLPYWDGMLPEKAAAVAAERAELQAQDAGKKKKKRRN